MRILADRTLAAFAFMCVFASIMWIMPSVGEPSAPLTHILWLA